MKIGKLLVANRGEIAVRIFRTCQELGIGTVAIYSEADANSMHVKVADESVSVGPSDSRQSYLDIAKVIEAAQSIGADAIHPGYGFLSERHEFAQACVNANIIFVGPSVESMRRLGDKISAKKLAVSVGAPIVPGYFEPGATLEDLLSASDEVGYPVMLKATAGGGGRGMRPVHSALEMPSALALAKMEALGAFGNDEMMVEKLIVDPRHVEVQVLADRFGKVVCLFERECSLQRRNQKMVEETPSPAVESGLVNWDDLRNAARKIVIAAEYTNAGTVEFIVDGTTGAFYFMEVNARLQVEHPVTEACTGLDLVAWQIRVAEGCPLKFDNSVIEGNRSALSGHAIEVRVLAENPAAGFVPSAGRIDAWSLPERLGVRVDTGFSRDDEISGYYDSLLAKVIAHGENRPAAIRKLILALEEFHVLGIKTNIGFLIDLLSDPRVQQGNLDTGLIERFLHDWDQPPIPGELLGFAERDVTVHSSRASSPNQPGCWGLEDRFRN